MAGCDAVIPLPHGLAVLENPQNYDTMDAGIQACARATPGSCERCANAAVCARWYDAKVDKWRYREPPKEATGPARRLTDEERYANTLPQLHSRTITERARTASYY